MAAGWPAPWSVVVDNIYFTFGKVDNLHKLPAAKEAARYIARLCTAFCVGSQCSAALAATFSLPLQCSTSILDLLIIELLTPTLLSLKKLLIDKQFPTEFAWIGYYMTLSLTPRCFESVL